MGKTTKLTTEQFIEKAKKIHGNKYDYSKVEYINNKTKVCIICPIHGEFWQTPLLHLCGHGCIQCYNHIKLTTEQFIEKAKKIHGNKYDYSKVEYINDKTKVCIICPIHGEFWQIPSYHLDGCECFKCSYINKPRHRINTLNEFVEKAKKIHGNKYDYSKVEYINNKTKVCIICHEKDKYGHEHGEFWQRPDNHIQGQRCPKCANKMSSLEKRIYDFCIKNDIKFEQQKKFEWLGNQRLDFYLSDYNIAIECQGEQHFKPIDFAGKGIEWAKESYLMRKQFDDNKKNLCANNNISIIYYTTKNINEKYNSNCLTDLRQILKILNKNEK